RPQVNESERFHAGVLHRIRLAYARGLEGRLALECLEPEMPMPTLGLQLSPFVLRAEREFELRALVGGLTDSRDPVSDEARQLHGLALPAFRQHSRRNRANV